MAYAVKNLKMVPQVVEVDEGVILTLSKEEAQELMNVVARSYRLPYAIRQALYSLGYRAPGGMLCLGGI